MDAAKKLSSKSFELRIDVADNLGNKMEKTVVVKGGFKIQELLMKLCTSDGRKRTWGDGGWWDNSNTVSAGSDGATHRGDIKTSEYSNPMGCVVAIVCARRPAAVRCCRLPCLHTRGHSPFSSLRGAKPCFLDGDGPLPQLEEEANPRRSASAFSVPAWLRPRFASLGLIRLTVKRRFDTVAMIICRCTPGPVMPCAMLLLGGVWRQRSVADMFMPSIIQNAGMGL